MKIETIEVEAYKLDIDSETLLADLEFLFNNFEIYYNVMPGPVVHFDDLGQVLHSINNVIYFDTQGHLVEP